MMKESMVCVSVVCLMISVLAQPILFGNDNQQSELLLQKAEYKVLVEGDVGSAIELCKEIIATGNGNRAVVAKAYLQMGQYYEKLGKSEAIKAYKQVVEEYTDQQAVVAQARIRLSAMERSNEKRTVKIRKVMADLNWWFGEGSPSPDNRYFAMTNESTFDLEVMDLASGELRRITHDGRNGIDNPHALSMDPIWSPDGKQIAHTWFHDGREDLRIVQLEDLETRVLWTDEDPAIFIKPYDWTQDGKFILGIQGSRLKNVDTRTIVLVSVRDGSVQTLKSIEKHMRGNFDMSISPDGRSIVYNRRANEKSEIQDIYIMNNDDSGKEHPSLDASDQFRVRPIWSHDGNHIAYVSRQINPTNVTMNLMLAELKDGKQVGEPQVVMRNSGRIKPRGFTRDGSLYFSRKANNSSSSLHITSIDMETGEYLSTPSALDIEGSNWSPSWSPDGKQLAYWSRRASPRGAGYVYKNVIVIRSIETGKERELTLDSNVFIDSNPVRWSPDGRSLLCGGVYTKGIHIVDAQTGHVKTVVESTAMQQGHLVEARIWSPIWSPDGKTIYYIRTLLEKGEWPNSIMAFDLATSQERELCLGGSPWSFLSVSPDGRIMAFSDDKLEALKTIPTAGGDIRELYRLYNKSEGPEEFEGVCPIMWTSDGQYLLFETGSGGYRTEYNKKVWRVPVDGGEAERLYDVDKQFGAFQWNTSIHAEGQQFAFVITEKLFENELWVVENLLPESP